MNTDKKTPPKAQRITRVADLQPERAPATYLIQNTNEKPTRVILQKRKRQIMDLLLEGPVYCASPVRISDVVHILKRETGLSVRTDMYPGDPATGSGDYGIYTLVSEVTRAEPGEVAA